VKKGKGGKGEGGGGGDTVSLRVKTRWRYEERDTVSTAFQMSHGRRLGNFDSCYVPANKGRIKCGSRASTWGNKSYGA
jgi:hypothetical protein